MIVASPGVESGVLEGASEAKGNRPREGAVFDDFGEIGGGLFGSLTAREEYDAGEIGGDASFEDLGCFDADFGWGGWLAVFFASNDHIAFENAGAEIDVIHGEFLKKLDEDLTGERSGLIYRIIAVVDEFWFDDGDDVGLLASQSVFGEDFAVFEYAGVGRGEDFAAVV